MRIHTQVDKQTIYHAADMIRSHVKLAANPTQLEFYLFTLNDKIKPWQGIKDTLIREGITNKIELINVKDAKTRSIGHAQAINEMLKSLDTTKINIVCDSDTLMVMPKWDNLILYCIEKKNIGTLGTPYEDIGGITSGTGKLQTYKGLPNVIWMLLSPGYKWEKIDMLPDKLERTPLSELEASINGLKKGWVLFKDVGWRIPRFIYNNEIPYITLDHVKSTSEKSVALKNIGWDYHEEYQINDMPFLLHHRGSSIHPWRKNKKSIKFYDTSWSYIEGIKDKEHDWENDLEIKGNLITAVEKNVREEIEFKENNFLDKNFVIATAMPRCASLYIANLLSECGIKCTHLNSFNFDRCGFGDDITGDSSWYAVHYLNKMSTDIPIIHQLRNPLDAISSFVSYDTAGKSETGSYLFNTMQSKKWVEEFAPDFDFDLEPIERAALAWINWNNKIESHNPILKYKIEDITFDVIENIGRIVGVQTTNKKYDYAIKKIKKKIQKDKKNKRILTEKDFSDKIWSMLKDVSKKYDYNI